MTGENKDEKLRRRMDMKEFKGQLTAFKEDGTLVIFDNREEYLKEFTRENGYTRVFASARDMVSSVNDEDTSFRQLSKRLAHLCEEFSIEVD